MERKEYGKAKELLAKIGTSRRKWYVLSDISIIEGDIALKQYKEKITNIFALNSLGVPLAANAFTNRINSMILKYEKA